MSLKEEVIELLIDRAVKMFGVSREELGPDTNFKDDLGCKSSNIVQFTTAIENEYDIEVPYMEFNRKATFADAADYIAELFE